MNEGSRRMAKGNVFRRELRLRDLVMVGVGSIIGSGWLFGAFYGAQLAGPVSIFGWAFAAVAILILALSYVELGATLPEAGGMIRYPQYTHSSLVSFIYAWTMWLGCASIIAIEAEGATQYLAHWVPGLFHDKTLSLSGIIVSLIFLALMIGLNYFGIKLFRYSNFILSVWKYVVPILTLIFAFVFGFHVDNLTSHGFAPYGFQGFFAAISTGGLAFSLYGFPRAIDLASEAKNPGRDLPKAVLICILLGGGLYVLLQFAFLMVIPPEALDSGWKSLSFAAPWADIMGLIGLFWMGTILMVDGIISPFGTGLVYTATNSRTVFALSENGSFPKFLQKLTDKGVPLNGMILNFIVGLVFLLPFPSWQSLVGVVSSFFAFSYSIGPISVYTLRRTVPDMPRSFRVKGLGVFAPLGFIIATWLIYWSGWSVVSKMGVLILLGIIVYAVYSVRNTSKNKDKMLKEILNVWWVVVYYIGLAVISYFGNYDGGQHTLPMPWDLIVAAAFALCVFYSGFISGYFTDDLRSMMHKTEGLQKGEIFQGENLAEEPESDRHSSNSLQG